jgi:Arc/MetJ-type ribon-helix-helix transcriptional regulator
MTIHLPPHIESSIHAAVFSGHFASMDEAMTEAATLLLQRLQQTQAKPTTASHAEAGQPRKPIWERIQERSAAMSAAAKD